MVNCELTSGNPVYLCFTIAQNVDDFDLRNVRTNITLSTDTSDFHWYRADHNIMDILLIAFQMTLARIAKQSVLILGRLEKVSM